MFRARYSPAGQQTGGLQHHLSICQLGNERVYLCLDINHAILDAHSRDIILRDLQTAYGADLDPHGAPFRNVVSYLRQQPQEEARRYWAKHLDGIEPCHFPLLVEGAAAHTRYETAEVSGLDAAVILEFCRKWEITPATVIQTAWALVLGRYTGSTSPCFGIFNSGRDLPIKDVNDIFGPLITMLSCRVQLHQQTSALDCLRTVQNDYLNSLPHQTFPVSTVQEVLGLGTSPLFNTVLNLHRVGTFRTEVSSDVSLHLHDGLDPMEYDVVIRAAFSKTVFQVGIHFQTRCMNVMQARRLTQLFSKTLHALTNNPNSRIRNLDLVPDREQH
ncbi:CoA-dependent acyltransferase [Periconia macrospinosa]|uniref:CoA-dependent acyltransferase n=1 Tax=Periconia macrospinosa TaxID=97972 RepID=A0A2V1CYZ4_9PLEO|nr:CoA-dependent acyltransferase [Periconia macrospinosa]